MINIPNNHKIVVATSDFAEQDTTSRCSPVPRDGLPDDLLIARELIVSVVPFMIVQFSDDRIDLEREGRKVSIVRDDWRQLAIEIVRSSKPIGIDEWWNILDRYAGDNA